MMRSWRAFALLVSLSLFLTLGVSAQDSAAENHALTLMRANNSGDSSYQTLLMSDPVLTKRAFVYLLKYALQTAETDEQMAETLLEYTVQLALEIQSYLGDPTPFQIIESSQSGDMGTMYQLADAYDAQLGGASTGNTNTNAAIAGQPPFSATGGNDPVARKHAYDMYVAMAAQDSARFQSLFHGNPDLTKKAFVSVIEAMLADYQANPNANITPAAEYASGLAQVIQAYLNDPVPMQIVQKIASGDSSVDQLMSSYYVSLYPQGGPRATAGSSVQGELIPEAWATGVPIRQHTYKLFQAARANNGSLDALVAQQPELSKKAFLASLELAALKPDTNMNLLRTFLQALAASIKTQTGDSVPSALLQDSADAGEYYNVVYPKLEKLDLGSSERYGEVTLTVSDVPPIISDILQPFMLKILRASLAVTFSDADLILQELDTFTTVFDSFASRVNALGDGSSDVDFSQDRKEAALMIGLIKLDVMAQYGLLHELDQKSLALVANEEPNDQLGLYCTGFRVALRQQQYPVAQSYLDKSQAIMAANPGEFSPIYRFVNETAKFQLRLARDGQVEPAKTLQAFNQAWSTLSEYKAVQKMADDISWYYGRDTIRFWVEQLAALGEDGETGLETMITATAEWLQGAQNFELGALMGSIDDLAFHYSELQGYLTVIFTGVDTMLAVLEQRPDMMSANAQSVDSVLEMAEQMATLGALLDQAAQLNLEEPGFPTFLLQDSSQMKRLRMRAGLLKGLNASKPAAERISILQNVLTQVGDLDHPQDYIDYHIQIGHAFKALNRTDLAIAAWERAHTRAEKLSFVTDSVETASLLAEEFGRNKDWKQSAIYVGKANKGMQDQMGTSDNTTGMEMAKKAGDLTELGAKAAIANNDPQKAMALLAEGQQMKNAAVQLSGDGEAAKATKSLQKKKKQLAVLTTKVNELKQMPESETRNEMLKKAETLLAESKSDFLLKSREIRRKFSGLYTTVLKYDPLNLPDVQKALPPGTAVVQYFATDQEFYIFVVTNSEFRLRSVKESKLALDSNIVNYLKEVQRPGLGDQKLDSLSTALYQTLITPIEEDIANSKTLVLIPSGKLNVLPFAALKGPDGKLLAEKKTLLEIAKATDFFTIASSEPTQVKSVVAFANATEDLPAAEKEGEAITKMFPGSTLYKRQDASRANLESFGGQSKGLHLATHGTWDTKNPHNNHLKLSNNQNLGQDDIVGLDLSGAALVTLSACSTALADSKDIEYQASLAEAFWIAGSRSVVASLWPVDDNSTGLLMTNFYQHLKDGDPKAEALRKAQMTVRQDERYAHPYYWSGFLLFGDYR